MDILWSVFFLVLCVESKHKMASTGVVHCPETPVFGGDSGDVVEARAVLSISHSVVEPEYTQIKSMPAKTKTRKTPPSKLSQLDVQTVSRSQRVVSDYDVQDSNNEDSSMEEPMEESMDDIYSAQMLRVGMHDEACSTVLEPTSPNGPPRAPERRLIQSSVPRLCDSNIARNSRHKKKQHHRVVGRHLPKSSLTYPTEMSTVNKKSVTANKTAKKPASEKTVAVPLDKPLAKNMDKDTADAADPKNNVKKPVRKTKAMFAAEFKQLGDKRKRVSEEIELITASVRVKTSVLEYAELLCVQEENRPDAPIAEVAQKKRAAGGKSEHTLNKKKPTHDDADDDEVEQETPEDETPVVPDEEEEEDDEDDEEDGEDE